MTKEPISNQEGKEDTEEKELAGCEDCPHKIMSDPQESRGDWEEEFAETFWWLKNVGAWKKLENFKAKETKLIDFIRQKKKEWETLAHTEGIEEVVELAKSLREPDDCGQNPKYPKDQCTPTCGHNNALNKIIIHYQQPKDK